jgi:holo-[acyl-carrier protein] synthase
MIVGIGIDSVAIERFNRWINCDRVTLRRVFSEQEIVYIMAVPSKATERMAVRFAAKEAFFKALSAAIPDHGIPFLTICRHVQVARARQGAPYLAIDWPFLGASALFSLRGQLRAHLSLTHTQTIGTAFVIIEK